MDEQLGREVTPEEAVDSIENAVGTYPGQRRAHTKGIAFDATFQPNGAASSLTTAKHLQDESVNAIVRFSHFWPTPNPHELLVPIKGMAVRFLLQENVFTNLVMANVPVFLTKTPEAFIRLVQVMAKEPLSITEKLEVLIKKPEFATIPKLLKSLKPPASFATETYHALHSFYLVSSEGTRQAVRFFWKPVKSSSVRKSYGSRIDLETELVKRLEDGLPVQFRLFIQLAQPEDPIDDPSLMWPADRQTIDIGMLSLNSVREDGAESLVFDPTVLTEGIECSDDPILHFRSPVYDLSAARRLRHM
ncbi:catalase-related peroxidase [Sporosarcina sp. NCCP-2222]|uniref:catalase n=1 Tax=Sporosarcina sp. NCCP-2222 TaxID=2935073 RepID=UPI002086C3F2|nr:catalase [Sporosarcina sp. NCCP-2222]GKV54146.1 catalase-related peroxidase [Sporosarcina sp. NCCP-2222]